MNSCLLTRLLLPLLAFSIGAYASDCDTVRLDAPGGSTYGISVRDQGSTGICYSEAAALAFDSSQVRAGSRNRSAEALAAVVGWANASRIDLKQAFMAGSFPCAIVNYFNQSGACDQRAFSGLGTEADFLSKSYAILDPQTRLPTSCGPASSQNPGDQARALLASKGCAVSASENSSVYLSTLATVTQTEEARFVSQVNQACQSAGRISPPHPLSCSSTMLPAASARASEKPLLDYFSNKTVPPLLIGYCSQVLHAGQGYVGVSPGAGKNTFSCDCAMHYSAVIGKRASPRTGKCQFLIQNSWGTDCDYYSHDWDCEAGKIWVDVDTLSRNIDNYGSVR